MKRVLAALLCLLLVFSMFALVSCNDDTDTNTDTNSGNEGNNSGNNQTAHVHTYKTDAEWSKDASGHWYDPTCECADAPRRKLQHVDDNKDAICDVCKFVYDHEHTYSEDWTVDCTNHWHAADCGCIIAGADVAKHADTNNDGVCDVCKYVINDLHKHIFATEWSGDAEYHWHAALCEHVGEIADKAAHVVNDAGFCTVCDAKIRDVDKTSIAAILAAAIANNYKVIDGNVTLEEIVYNGSEKNNTLTLLDAGTTDYYFVLGNGQSYVFTKSFDKNGKYEGGDQQWFETLANGDIFGVEMVHGSYELNPIDGIPEKLSGYNYTPGSILQAGYDDTSTLAQTLYAFYDIMTKGVNVSDAKSNYDAETGKYSFSFTYFTVNETTSQGVVTDTQLALYETEIEFTVDSNFVIDLAEFQVKVYNYYNGGADENDLTYDAETNTMTKTDSANPSYYIYTVNQHSGERTFTTPYPKASLMPTGFNFYYITDFDFPSSTEFVINSEELIKDSLTVAQGEYVYFHLGDPVPSNTSFDFISTDNFEFSFVNNDSNSTARAWYMDPGSVDEMLNGYSQYISCLKLKMRDPGEYTMTVKFGDLVKTFTLTIEGEKAPEISGDADSISVLLTNFNAYDDEKQTYTYTATAEGNYTFTVPAGLGVRIDGEDAPRVDLYAENGGTFTVGLNAGDTVKLYFATGDATRYEVQVSYVAADIPDEEQGGGTETPSVTETALNPNGYNQVNQKNTAFKYTAPAAGKLTISIGGFVMDTAGSASYSVNGAAATALPANSSAELTLAAGDEVVVTVLTNGYATITAAWVEDTTAGGGDDEDTLQGSGKEDDPYILPEAGDYVCAFPGQSDVVWYKLTLANGGYVTVSTTFGEGGWIKLGTNTMIAASNEGSGEAITAYYPAGTVLYVGIGDYNESTTDIEFTVAVEEVTSDPIDAVVGTWSGVEETMWGGTIKYLLTINDDGTGTLVYNDGFPQNTECTLDYVLVEGTKVTFGYSNANTSGSLVCTIATDALNCTAGIYHMEFTLTPGAGAFEGEEQEPDYEAEIVVGENTVWISEEEMTADTATRPLVIITDSEYSITAGSLYTAAVADSDGNAIEKTANGTYVLSAGNYTVRFDNLSMFGASADTPLDLVVTDVNAGGGEDTSDTAAVNGYYGLQPNGYYLMIYENSGVFENIDGGYVAEIFDEDYNVDLYFTVTATANGDGSYTLALEYVSRPDYESGTDNVDAILAETYIITPESGEEGGEGGGDDGDKTPLEALDGTYVDNALNGYNVGFYYDTDAGVYYLNVYGGTQDLYYTAVPTENADGSVTLALTLCTDHWLYFGNAVTDEYELDGKTVVATPAGSTWTFAVEGAGSGEEEDTADGTFEKPYELKESNTCEFPGGMNFVWYAFTAPTAGKATITITSDDFYWAYAFNESSVENIGALASASLNLTAGQTIYIGMASNSGNAATIEFAATFEPGTGGGEEPVETQGTLDNPYTLEESNSCEFPGGMDYVWYAYTAEEAGSITITMTSSDFYWAYAYNVNSVENVGTKTSLTLALEAGQTIYVGISTNSANAATVEFTAVFGAGSEEVTVVETPMVMGNNNVNAADVNFAYTAAADVTLNVAVGTPAMGAVTVTYSVNGATPVAIANGTNLDVALTAGDKLVVSATTTSGYMTITVTEKVEEDVTVGTSSNPIVIESLPYDIVVTGKHDKYYTFTATEDIVLTITAPTGCYVTNDKNATNVGGVYTIALSADEAVSLNIWTNSTDATEYTYTITGAAPETGDGNGEGGGEATGADGVYLASHASGRKFQVTIDSAAGTITIIRSDLTGSLTTGGATTYTASYAFDGSTVTYGGTYAMQFDENGAPIQLVWGTATVTGFVKQ